VSEAFLNVEILMADGLTEDLEEVVHQRTRLGILTVLHGVSEVDFGYLQHALGLSAGNLSQHLSVLEESALIRIKKGYEGRKGKTWLSITKVGTAALRNEIKVLKAIVKLVEAAED
jgi:DNA-binding transcriptional ArsR family regulator